MFAYKFYCLIDIIIIIRKHPYMDSSSSQNINNQRRVNLNLEKVKNIILYCQKNLNTGSGDDEVVIFWGYTGTGKSTSICTLSGRAMYGYAQHMEYKLSNHRTIEDEKKQQEKHQRGQSNVFTGTNIKSATIYPSSLYMKKTEPGNKNILMWDSPGFGDNKGITQILINTYLLNRLFSLQQKVKLIFTINYDDIKTTQRGQRFINIVDTLTSMLKYFHNYEQSMALLITKTQQRTTKDDLYKLLSQNAQLKYIKQNPQLTRFFEIIKSKKIRILQIHMPQIQNYNDTKNRAQVTHQYNQFLDDFYQTVTSLKNANVPKFQASGLNQQEMNQCIRFGRSTKDQLLRAGQQLFGNILKIISAKYSQVKFFHDDVKNDPQEVTKRNKQSLSHIQSVRSFINSLQKLSNKQRRTKVQYLDGLSELNNILVAPYINFECEKKNDGQICKSVQNIKNISIIVDFLSCVDIPRLQSQQLKYQVLMQQLYNRLNIYVLQYKKKQGQQEVNAKNILTCHIQSIIKKNISLFPKQLIYINWLYNLKFVPIAYLNICKLDNSSNFVTFTEYSKFISSQKAKIGIQQNEKHRKFMQFLQYISPKLKSEKFSINQSIVLDSKIKPIMLSQRDHLNQELKIGKWNRNQLVNLQLSAILNRQKIYQLAVLTKKIQENEQKLKGLVDGGCGVCKIM